MKQTISAVIIEDEEEATIYLTSILQKLCDSIQIIATSNCVIDAIKILNSTTPELVFMDIKLLDGDAFQILDAIHDYNFEVIFITAYSDYLEKALEYHAFNFVQKPIDTAKLKNIVQRYIRLKDRLFTKQKYIVFKEFMTESRLLIYTGNEHNLLEIDSIIKCCADGNYTIFTTKHKRDYLASKPLKYYEELLSEKGFFRASRSVLVNIKHIQSIYKKESLVLSNNEKVIVSTRNKSKLTNLIKELA